MSTASVAAPPPAAPATPGRARLAPILTCLFIAMLIGSLDQTIFSTALPTIVGDLGGVDHMLWVTTAYLVASTITMPIYGKLGDVMGRKWLFVAAIAFMLLGSIIGGAAGDMTWLIIGRAVQGLGGGGLMILSQSIIADVVPVRERSKYMGAMGAVFGVSAVVGPLLGGWFAQSLDWRWAFWINIPLCALAIAVSVIVLKLPRPENRVRVDVAGIITMAVAVTSIILVSTWGGSEYEWGSPTILWLIAIAVVAAAAFVWAEAKAADPLMPLALFKNRNFVLATVAGLFIGVAMFGTIGYLPTYLQMVSGVSATVSGYMLLPMMAGLMLTSIGMGAIMSKTGRYKWMPIVGLAIVAVALYLLSTLTVETATVVLLSYLFVLGFGIGCAMQVLVVVVQNSFPDDMVGTATASNNFFREIGASLGGAVVGAVFTDNLTTLLSERLGALGGGAGGAVSENSLTPQAVNELPAPIHDAVVGSYNDALTPVFTLLIPMVLAGLLLFLFVKEVPLRAGREVSSDVSSEAGEGAGASAAAGVAEASAALVDTAGSAVVAGEPSAELPGTLGSKRIGGSAARPAGEPSAPTQD
ncbi:MAG: MFS transporter [Arthrobacter sp.]|nr:MFS transporter [Arthrobacter sp.]